MRKTVISAAIAFTATGVWAAEDAPLLKRAEAARIMYDAGQDARDPLLIIAAAKLQRSLGLEASDRAPEGGSAIQDDSFGWQAMLGTAESLSTGDPLMLGLIEDVRAAKTKGVLNGPVYNIGKLGAKATDTYGSVPFKGGTYAEIYVEATGNQDMNLKIFDAQNRLVCSDTDASSIAYCGWRPKSDGKFSIKVSNASGSAAQYRMITN